MRFRCYKQKTKRGGGKYIYIYVCVSLVGSEQRSGAIDAHFDGDLLSPARTHLYFGSHLDLCSNTDILRASSVSQAGIDPVVSRCLWQEKAQSSPTLNMQTLVSEAPFFINAYLVVFPTSPSRALSLGYPRVIRCIVSFETFASAPGRPSMWKCGL